MNRRKQVVTVVLDPKAIGRRIRETRKRLGWCIADLARVVGNHPFPSGRYWKRDGEEARRYKVSLIHFIY